VKTRSFLAGVACCLASALTGNAELFVASFSGNRVHRYSETNGAAIGTSVFVTNGSGGLNLPHGMAFGPDGNLYVASAGNDAVLRYHGTNGSFLDAFIPSDNGVLDYPVWLEFRPDGFLYVSSQLNHCVARFNATNGAFAGLFVTNGSGGLNGPSGMTWGNDGHLYVTGRFGSQLLKYDGTNGAFLAALASGAPLAQPFGVQVGPDGNLYVANGNSNSVARFHGVTGTFLGNFVAAGSGGLSLPIGLGFGPNGALYVASFNNNKVARYDGGTGAYVADFVSSGSGGLAGPNFLAFRPARTFSTNIPGIGPVGPVEQRHLGLMFTEGPAADAHGNVYFSDVQAARIYRSDTRGLLSVFLPNSSACNGLMFDQRGRLIACQRDQRRMIAIDVTTTNVTPLATNFMSRAFIGPNDVVVDWQGGAYFSDPNFSSGQTGPTQSVYYVSAAGVVSQIASNLSRPNGVILSRDETTLHVVLSGAARLMSYPILAPGVVGAPVTNTIPATGDGMTLDTQGNLYLCQPGVNQILVRSPAGATLGSITFPESPANCAFGGKDMKTLFVTARTSLYVCRMAAQGHRFAWNPASYADFQLKFFAATNSLTAQLAADPDGDGASNELEYLARTHPLCPGDAWRLDIRRNGLGVELSFPAWSDRGYVIEANDALPNPSGWHDAGLPITLPGPPKLPQTATAADAPAGTNRFYRARVSSAP
jgi:gluconolactonase